MATSNKKTKQRDPVLTESATLQPEGAISGRRFAVRRDDAGAVTAYVCLYPKNAAGDPCRAESPTVERFARHKCGSDSAAAETAKE